MSDLKRQILQFYGPINERLYVPDSKCVNRFASSEEKDRKKCLEFDGSPFFLLLFHSSSSRLMDLLPRPDSVCDSPSDAHDFVLFDHKNVKKYGEPEKRSLWKMKTSDYASGLFAYLNVMATRLRGIKKAPNEFITRYKLILLRILWSRIRSIASQSLPLINPLTIRAGTRVAAGRATRAQVRRKCVNESMAKYLLGKKRWPIKRSPE